MITINFAVPIRCASGSAEADQGNLLGESGKGVGEQTGEGTGQGRGPPWSGSHSSVYPLSPVAGISHPKPLLPRGEGSVNSPSPQFSGPI